MYACMHACCSTLKLQELWIASPGFSWVLLVEHSNC
jgi:hypothetical protein